MWKLGKEGMAMLKSGGPAWAGKSFQLYGDAEEGSRPHVCLKACAWLHYYCGWPRGIYISWAFQLVFVVFNILTSKVEEMYVDAPVWREKEIRESLYIWV